REQNASDGYCAAFPVEVELVDIAVAVDQYPREHEQRSLCKPVAYDVHRHGGEPLRTQETDPAEEHADMADGRERQETFEMALGNAHDRPPQRSQRPEGDQNRA